MSPSRRRKLFSAVIIVALVITSYQSGGRAHAQAKLAPGLEPYTPTRIEWLTMDLEASNRVELSSETGCSLDYATADSDTVTIFVRHLPTADRRIINMAVDTARKLITSSAKRYGWDGWVRVREDIEMAKGTRE